VVVVPVAAAASPAAAPSAMSASERLHVHVPRERHSRALQPCT
jgi:hypothetical protein